MDAKNDTKRLSELIGGKITDTVVLGGHGGETFIGIRILLPDGIRKDLFFLSDDEPDRNPGWFDIVHQGSAEFS